MLKKLKVICRFDFNKFVFGGTSKVHADGNKRIKSVILIGSLAINDLIFRMKLFPWPIRMSPQALTM